MRENDRKSMLLNVCVILAFIIKSNQLAEVLSREQIIFLFEQCTEKVELLFLYPRREKIAFFTEMQNLMSSTKKAN